VLPSTKKKTMECFTYQLDNEKEKELHKRLQKNAYIEAVIFYIIFIFCITIDNEKEKEIFFFTYQLVCKAFHCLFLYIPALHKAFQTM
jgi:hypothetical protein